MDSAKPQLIALYSSSMQSGKSTVAETLQLSRGYKLVKFADPFKTFIKDLLIAGGAPPPAAERMVEDGTLKEKPIPGLGGVTVRRMLQTLGSEWGRDQIDSDLWVKLLARKVQECFDCGVSVVVDDLRFPNEYEGILKMGGALGRRRPPASLRGSPRQLPHAGTDEYRNRGAT